MKKSILYFSLFIIFVFSASGTFSQPRDLKPVVRDLKNLGHPKNDKPISVSEPGSVSIIINVPANYSTIQAAINAANIGDVITVDAGVYRENITLNKYLSIRGANYGINPNTGIRGPETIIQPATSDPDPYSPTAVTFFYITPAGSGSTIDGFTFDGDNPTLTSTVNINGANIDAAEALGAYDGLANLVVRNNIVKNLNYAGIDFYNYFNGGASTYDNSITNNKFDNIIPDQFGIGVLIYNNCYAAITDNVMTRVRVGVQTGNFYSADLGTSHTISNNTIESYRIGVWHNLTYTNATTFTISNNIITTLAGAPNNNGIEISSVQSAVSVNVNNNSITGARAGYNLWNCPTTSTVTVTGGNVTSCKIGVFANNYDGYSSNADPSVYAMTGVTITNCDTAIWVRDNNLNTNGATVALNVNNTTNFVNGTGIGLLLEGGDASVTFNGAVPVDFNTSLSKYIRLITNGSNAPTATVNAQSVNFGGLNGSAMTNSQLFAVEDKIDHKIDWSSLGFVSVKPYNNYVTTNSFYPPNTSSASIQTAIDAATAGDTTNIDAGTFYENVIANKSITLKGSGSSSTILTPSVACTGDGINITSSNVNVNDLRVTNYNFGLRTSSSTIRLYNVESVLNCQYALNTSTGTNGLTILKCKFNNNTVGGWRAGTGDLVSNVLVDSCEVKDNGVGINNGFGIFIAASTPAANTFDNITIKNSDFSNNLKKGMYFEKLRYALIDNVFMNNSGTDATYGFNNGIDINLKYDTYSDITIQNCTITNCGSMGTATDVNNPCAITVKARDDSPSYNSDPATLTTVNIKNNFVSGPVNGLRFGEFNKTNNSPTGNTVIENDFGNGYSNKAILNKTANLISVSCNWYGTTVASAVVALHGSNLSMIPYLVNGTDNNPGNPGFQPVPGSCTGSGPVINLTQSISYIAIQPAIDAANPNDVIEASAGTYNERVTITKSLTLQGTSETACIIDGTGLAGTGKGITINNGITNVTIKKLTVQNFAGSNGNTDAGIYGIGGNNNLLIEHVTLQNNVGGSGFYANGPVNTVTLDSVTSSGHTSSARGIVIWNGLKENITFTNCTVFGNSCCGMELQDGQASGVTVTNNNIHDNADNGIGLVGLQGPGENLIKNNTLVNNGRFGIEIKNPNGSGLPTGPGRIVIEDNNVSRTAAIVDNRDICGIAAFRRSVLAGNVDIPTGTIIQNNTVSGYVQPSVSEGFGIVVEGYNHLVSGNTVSGCDVGIQRQAGHLPYPGDGDQSNVADTYFGRGNSPATCGVTLTGNILSNTINTRDVGTTGSGIVTNVNTSEVFCSIQAAIDDPQTLNTHVINVDTGSYSESVTISKQVTIQGNGGSPNSKPIITGVSGQTFSVTAPNVTITNLQIRFNQGTVNTGIRAATSGSFSNLTVKNCQIYGTATTGSAIFGSFGMQLGSFGGVLYDQVNIDSLDIKHTGTSPLGRGVRTFNCYGDWKNSSVDGFYNFQAGDNQGGILNIMNNNLKGETEINYLGAGAHSFVNNVCDPANAFGPGTDFALLELKNISLPAASLLISGNSFQNYSIFGLFSGRANNITIDNNTFTPNLAAVNFRSIRIDTKQRTTAPQSAFTSGAAILNNTFFGNTAVGQAGISVEIANSDSVSSIGTVAIGSSGNENLFNINVSKKISLNNETGSTVSDPVWTGTYVSIKKKVNSNVTATDNKYDVGTGLEFPSSMSLGHLFDLEDLIQHRIDDGGLGFVTVKANNDYVTPNSFVAPATTTPSIQRGLDAASSGFTVNVDTGSFTGQLEITKSLTLLGQGVGLTNVVSPNVLTLSYTTSGVNKPVVFVHTASDAVIRNVTVDGAGKGNANNRFQGIAYRNAGGTVRDCEIKAIRNTPIDGVQGGVGLFAIADSGVSRSLNMIKTNIYDFQKNATVFTGADLSVKCDSNTITGAGPVSFIAQNGVQLSSGAQGSITHNTISGISYIPSTVVSCGVLLFDPASPDTTSNNTLTGCQMGIYYIDAGGLISENTINSTAANTGTVYYWGIDADPGDRPKVKAQPHDYPETSERGSNSPRSITTSIYRNVLTSDGTNGTGIEMDALGTETLNATATENKVNGWDAAVVFYKDAGATLNGAVNYNDLSGNTYALYDLTGVTQDGTCNWFGFTVGYFIAPKVVGAVNYSPWSTNGTDNDGGTIGFQPVPGSCNGIVLSKLYVNDNSTSGDVYTTAVGNDANPGTPAAPFRTVNFAVSVSSPGDTIFVDAGTYVEDIVVDNSLDIRGANYGVNPNTGSRVSESILMPSTNDPEEGVLVNIQQSNIRIDGFLLNGDNPGLSGGYGVGSADVNVSEGICNGPALGPYYQIDSANIRNNIFNNFDYQAVYLEVNFNTNQSWNYIRDNKFDNMWEGIQTYAIHADISHNVFTEVDRAISTHGVNVNCDAGFVPRIDSNEVSISWKNPNILTRNVGIWVNYRRGTAPDYSVTGNILHYPSAAPSGKKFIGFYALTITDNRVVNFTNNTIDGQSNIHRGFYMSNCPSSNVSITGGSFSNVKEHGILMVNNDPSWGQGDVRLRVTDLPISMVSGSTAGVSVSIDNAFASLGGPTELNQRMNRGEETIKKQSVQTDNPTYLGALDISGSTISGSMGTGIAVSGQLASAKIHDNDSTITGATVGIDVNEGSATINRNNITANGTGVRVTNNGNVDSLTQNFITSNTSDAVSIESTAGTIGIVTENDLSGNTGYDIKYSKASPTLSSTCNWYGSVDANFIGSKVNGLVTFVPYLTNGTDNNPGMAGFQAVPGSCNGTITNRYVNDNSLSGDVYTTAVGNNTNSGTSTAPFATLSHAISVSNPNDTIWVDAGTYPENDTANKSLVIYGANKGIEGYAARVPESIVRTNGNQNAVFTITASNVTVDGLTVDGDDPNLTGSPVASGDDANCLYAFRPTVLISNLTIRNNIIKKVAIGLRGDIGLSSGNVVTRNLFDAIGNFDFGYAVSVRNNFYADVTHNKMTRVWTGLHTTNHYLAGGPPSWKLVGNEIHSYASGLCYWLSYQNATPLTVDSNQFIAETGAAANNFGMLMVSIQDAVNPSFTNNTITGTEYGAGLFNISTSNNITLGSTNSISSTTKSGILFTNNLNFNPVGLTNFLAGGPGAASTLKISGVGIAPSGGNGIQVDASLGTVQTLNVISATTLNGGTNGLVMKGAACALTGNNINSLTFTGQTGNYVTLLDTAFQTVTVDATSTLFDGSTGAGKTIAQNFAAEDKISHKIDNSLLGFVLVKANNDFVTVNSYAAPVTTTPSIQRGINAASAGFTTNVNSGSYTEQIEIPKNLTLSGQGTTVTNIVSPNVLALSYNSGGVNKPVVFVHSASDVIIQGVTVDGAGKGNSNSRFQGIAYVNAGGTVRDCEVKAVRNSPLDGTQAGIGIFGVADSGTARTLNVIKNTIYDFQKNGAAFSGADLRVEVDSNTVTGAGPTSTIAQNGFQISSSAIGNVRYNTISSMSYTPGSSVACGVLMFAPNGPDTTSRNAITACQVGVLYQDIGGHISENTISATAANTGTTQYWGIVADPGDEPRVNSNPYIDNENQKYTRNMLDAPIINTTIYRNVVTSTGNNGTGIEMDALGSSTLNVSATENKVNGWQAGMLFFRQLAATLNGTVNDNDLSSNTYSLFGTTGPAQNGTCNWFGTADQSVIMTKVTGSVNYSPYLTNGTDNDGGTIGFQPVPGSCNGYAIVARYVNDNSLSGDVFTTAVGSNANPGTSTAPYLTISYALSQAHVNDTIYIDAGTYQEQVFIDTSLTIIGADSAGPSAATIKAPVVMSTVANANASDHKPVVYVSGAGNTVNIRGICVDGDGRGGDKFSGVYYFEASGTFRNSRITKVRDATYSGMQSGNAFFANHTYDVSLNHTVTVTNNVIDDFQKTGILINEINTHGIVTNNIVTGQNIQHVNAQNGIQFGYGAYGTITGNDVSNCDYNGPSADAASGILLAGVGVDQNNIPTGGLTTVGGAGALMNNLHGDEVGILVDGGGFGYDSNMGVTYNANTFANNYIHVSLSAPNTVPPGSNVYDKRVDNTSQTNIVYGQIQRAVNDASATNVLNISGHTFTEQVEIMKPLTLSGQGAGITKIVSPNVLPISFTTSGVNKPVVFVHGGVDGVTIKNLTVDGAGKGNANNRFQGIAFRNAGGTVRDCEIKAIRNTPIDGVQAGVGLFIIADSGVSRTVNVIKNNINDFQKNATVFTGANLYVKCDSNTLTGAGPVSFIAQNGVQLSGGAGGIITHNTISGLSYVPSTVVSCGVLLFDPAGPDTTSANTLTGCQMGIYYINVGGLISENIINSTAANTGTTSYWGIDADPGNKPNVIAQPFDEPETSKRSGNVLSPRSLTTFIYRNELTSDGTNGVGIEMDALGTETLNATAEENKVNGWDAAVVFYKDAGATLNGNANNNDLSNSTYALYDLTGVNQNGTCNWFGTTNGGIITSKVFGSVTYSYFLVNGTDNNPSIPGFQPVGGACTGLLASTLNVKVIEEGFYDSTTAQLRKSDTAKARLHSNIPPYNVVDSSVAVIDSLTYNAPFQFLNAPTGTYYIVIRHRNTIETWSKSGGEPFVNGGTMYYDFTDLATKAFGNNMTQVDTTPNRFAMFSGDINQDSIVDLSDITLAFNSANNFTSGYVAEDVTGDDFVDLSDIVITYNNASIVALVVKP